jgi:ABC-type dipeptide/oligopeptide/nickel transport system permease subunit
VRRSPLTLAGLVIVAVFVLIALGAPWIVIQNPVAQDLAHRLTGPNPTHPFGLDSLGRDVYSRVIYGARISVISDGLAAGGTKG